MSEERKDPAPKGPGVIPTTVHDPLCLADPAIGEAMTDLELLTQTLDRLNIDYGMNDYEWEGVVQKIITLKGDHSTARKGKIPYTGYSGFAWLFTFSLDGALVEVGGYE